MRVSTLTPMKMSIFLAAATMMSAVAGAASSKKYCPRGDARCWPTAADVAALTAALDPTATRILAWKGPGTPRVSAVPVNSTGP